MDYRCLHILKRFEAQNVELPVGSYPVCQCPDIPVLRISNSMFIKFINALNLYAAIDIGKQIRSIVLNIMLEAF